MRVIRHGKSVQNAEHAGTFDTGDPQLHSDGYAQARELGRHLDDTGGIDVLITSPATRAVETARLIGEITGAQVVIHPDAHEFNWGSWSGKPTKVAFTPAEQERANREGWDYRPNPYAETMRESYLRMQHVVDEALDEHDGAIGLVGHSFAVKCLLGGELGMNRQEVIDFKIGNCEMYGFNPQEPSLPVELFRPHTA